MWRRLAVTATAGGAILAGSIHGNEGHNFITACDPEQHRRVQSVQAGPSNWHHTACEALQSDGCCIVRGLVPHKEVDKWREVGVHEVFSHCQLLLDGIRRATQVDYGPRKVFEGTMPGQFCGKFIQGSRGRFHWMPEEGEQLRQLIASQDHRWMPIVTSFMMSNQASRSKPLSACDIYM